MTKFTHLENVEETAKSHPTSFFIPSLSERKSQKEGDEVRLHFHLTSSDQDAPRAERMWVVVSKKLSLFGTYKGVLQNQPQYIEDLSEGDIITFRPTNIAQIYVPIENESWFSMGNLKAFASEACFSEGECVRFLYREEPDNKDDSGWRMFSGTESQNYTDEPRNIRLPAVGWLMDFDPSLKSIIEEPVGSVFERNDGSPDWTRVTDWTPEN